MCALSGDLCSRYWVRVLEQMQRRGTNRAGGQSKSGEGPEDWELDFLVALLLLALILRLLFPVNSAVSPSGEQAGRELGVATTEALCGEGI